MLRTVQTHCTWYRHGGPGCEEELRAALDKVKAIARREKRTVSDLAMAWCLADPRVVSIIPGEVRVAPLPDGKI